MFRVLRNQMAEVLKKKEEKTSKMRQRKGQKRRGGGREGERRGLMFLMFCYSLDYGQASALESGLAA